MYTVKLYNNTGYNVENIPDSAALLGTPSIEKTAVDTVQNYVMTSVRISAIFDDVKNADYCQIGDFYYFIAGVTMTSRDVAVLSLIPDYITSFGISNLNFLDGITVRHHVDDDSFGLYTEDDPLLYCNEPLELEVDDPLFDDGTGLKKSFVLSTVDLQTAGDGQTYNAVTYADSQGNDVTVPHLPPLASTQQTSFEIEAAQTNPSFILPGIALFPLYNMLPTTPNDQVLKGVQFCRDLAAETAIVDCYQIPTQYINRETLGTDGSMHAIEGTVALATAGIFYANPSQMPRNARVLYGAYNKFGLMTMSGNKIEAKPEEIYYAGAVTTTAPRVIVVADPRPDGKPYFRFEYVNKETPVIQSGGVDYVELNKFWRSVIPGEAWYHVPLVYTSPSGIIQQQKYYDNSRQLADTNFGQQDMANAWNLYSAGTDVILGAAGQGLGVPTRSSSMAPYDPNSGGNRYIRTTWTDPSIGGNFASQMTGAQGQIGTMGGYFGSLATKNVNANNYGFNRWRDAYNLGLMKSVVVPDVMFPYTNGTIRDFVGNGVIVYKYRPSDKDMELQDKLLTMYGYAVTDKLVQSHFFNRQYFNYVQANSVSIGNHIPQWWKAGIIAQLAGGVRVWHVTPDETHYDNNPIVVNP